MSISNISEILKAGDLANLPESSHNVRVYTMHFMLSAEGYIRFKAKPDDIEQFITNSPSLAGITYKTYSKERMRLATTDYGKILALELKDDPNQARFIKDIPDDGHEYFYSVNIPPSWFKNEIRGAGRYCNFSNKDSYWSEELIVDDEKNIVYISRIRIQ
ncbi:MAG: hypothetical protein JW787_07295 [Sedimentisphaerales bacterium]|nr:hypothetical protein [Sedimentisphaerales bacterium]